MLMLAVPMTVLFLISEGIARVIDRRRRRQAAEEGLEGLDDDVASPLPYSAEDFTASPLDEED
jgi:sec-independent protein translocase protein TatC